jgi:hypothetical protein
MAIYYMLHGGLYQATVRAIMLYKAFTCFNWAEKLMCELNKLYEVFTYNKVVTKYIYLAFYCPRWQTGQRRQLQVTDSDKLYNKSSLSIFLNKFLLCVTIVLWEVKLFQVRG